MVLLLPFFFYLPETEGEGDSFYHPEACMGNVLFFFFSFLVKKKVVSIALCYIHIIIVYTSKYCFIFQNQNHSKGNPFFFLNVINPVSHV